MSGEKCFPPIPVGSFVVVAVPEVDRDKIDAKNILVIEIIMDVTDDEYYKVGCKDGITNSLYSRNQMSMCKENVVSQETFNIPRFPSLAPLADNSVSSPIGNASDTGHNILW
ncbi:hypothetical protein ILUMI_13219 [Ignelater luminosus]|uniref:Uncharacterized protein n=1 Tax=Ignelater luminosus TaxID=2038154 RepID=A0A8K0CY61_IGNLU|nr:hypothetical protein ILUMI_13219 [Ignelater luminosus]